ncbi:MAG: hypothetical protein WD271_07825 [Acidimicrobiia bacterium]
MNVAVRLVLFALLLVAVFAAGLGIGTAVGPVDDAPPRHTEHLR